MQPWQPKKPTPASKPPRKSKFFTSKEDHERNKRAYHSKPKSKQSAAHPTYLQQWIEKNGPYLYHATDAPYDILREGLYPHDVERYEGEFRPWEKSRSIWQNQYYEPRPGHVYLGTYDRAQAANGAQQAEKEQATGGWGQQADPQYLRVDLRQLDPQHINPDEDFFDQFPFAPEVQAVTQQTPVPSPDRHALWREYHKTPRPENLGQWAERADIGNDPSQTHASLSRHGSVAYRGVIPPSALSMAKDEDEFADNAYINPHIHELQPSIPTRPSDVNYEQLKSDLSTFSSVQPFNVSVKIPRFTGKALFRWAREQRWPDGTKLLDPSEYQITLMHAPGIDLEDEDRHWWVENLDHATASIKGVIVLPGQTDKGYPYALRLDSEAIEEHSRKMRQRAMAMGVKVTPQSDTPSIIFAYGPTQSINDVSPPMIQFDVGMGPEDAHEIHERFQHPSLPGSMEFEGGWRFGEYDYRGQHTAPGPHYGWPITDMEAGAPDFYTHPKYYMYNDPQYDHESLNAILPARNNPESMVTIHRAGITPEINTGDWITPSHSYAKHHALANFRDTEQPKVWSARVPAKHVWWNGDDLNEYGYHGPPIQGQRFYRTQSNPELRPGSEVMTAYSPQEAQVLDQMSLASVAHNLHYRFEKGANEGEMVDYAQRLLKLIGYPPDPLTTQAAVQAWQQMYPADQLLGTFEPKQVQAGEFTDEQRRIWNEHGRPFPLTLPPDRTPTPPPRTPHPPGSSPWPGVEGVIPQTPQPAPRQQGTISEIMDLLKPVPGQVRMQTPTPTPPQTPTKPPPSPIQVDRRRSSEMARDHFGKLPGDEKMNGEVYVHRANPDSGVNPSYKGIVQGERTPEGLPQAVPVYIKPEGNFHENDLANERAAYLIAKRMGYNMPETAIREVDVPAHRMSPWDDIADVPKRKKIAQVQRDVGGINLGTRYMPARMYSEGSDPNSFFHTHRPEDARRMALFDAMIANTDRHWGNAKEGDDGQIYPIDHGGAFGNYPHWQHENHMHFNNTPLSEEETKMLQDLRKPATIGRDEDLYDDLRETGLSHEAAQRVLNRIDQMLDSGKLLGNYW